VNFDNSIKYSSNTGSNARKKSECLRCDINIEPLLVDQFEEIDQKCQDAFEDYYGNETKILEEIQKLHLVTKRIRNKKKLFN